MKKGWIISLTLIILSIIFVAISFLNAATQSANSIIINIDGTVRNLEVQSSYFYGAHTYSSVSTKTIGQHDASEIWVSVAAGEMTLLQAFQTNKLCPKSTSPLTYSFSPADKTKPYHFATEVILSSGGTLQQAINKGKFNSTYYWCNSTDQDRYANDSCGTTKLMKIQDCGDSSCGSWGSIYSSGGRRYQDRTCHDKGCGSGACFDTTRTETQDLGAVSTTTEGHGGSQSTSPSLPDTVVGPSTGGTGTVDPDTGEVSWDGGGGGGGGGGKVICTELYNTGIINRETYLMDLIYAKIHFSAEALRGYQAWAIPVVKAMRESPEIKEIVIPLTKSFLEEVAYRSGKAETGNEAGKILLDEGLPLFERIGKYIDEPEWEDLFNEKSLIDYLKSLFDKENEYDILVRDYFTEEKVREIATYIKEKGESSQTATAKAVIESLKKNVEEVESLIKENE